MAYDTRCADCGRFWEEHQLDKRDPSFGKCCMAGPERVQVAPGVFRGFMSPTPAADNPHGDFVPGAEYPMSLHKRNKYGSVDSCQVRNADRERDARKHGWVSSIRDLPPSAAADAEEDGSLDGKLGLLQRLEDILLVQAVDGDASEVTLRRVIAERDSLALKIAIMVKAEKYEQKKEKAMA